MATPCWSPWRSVSRARAWLTSFLNSNTQPLVGLLVVSKTHSIRISLTIFAAFVVAWGGTAAQSGRLAGLLILSLELKKLTVRRGEIYILWILLLTLLGERVGNASAA